MNDKLIKDNPIKDKRKRVRPVDSDFVKDKLMTVAEAARQKRVSRSAIYKAIEQKRLKSQWVLGRMALSHEEITLWQPHTKPGWPKGKPVSEETKARISESQKRRWKHHKRQGQQAKAK